MREEIGVDEDVVGRCEGSVVLKKEGGGDLRNLSDKFIVVRLLLCFILALVLVLLEAGISLADDTLD